MNTRFLCRHVLVLSVALSFVPVIASAEDFFETRASVFKAYGAASEPDLVRLYHDTRRTALESRSTGLLYRCAAYAELAGLHGELEKTFADILSDGPADPRFIAYCVEALRSRGALTANVPLILRASSKLDSDGRDLVLAALADSFAWSKPPAEVLAAVRKGVAGVKSASHAVVIAAALASWGLPGEASSALVARASSTTSFRDFLGVVNALNQIGDRKAARKAASDWFASKYPAPAAPGATLEELLAERESALEPAIEIADAASAWDLLLDKLAPARARKDEPVIDASIALESAGRFAERADLLRRLYESRSDADYAALYGNALIAAGDAYMTQTTLTVSALSGKGLDDEPYLDLFDAVAILRDPQVLLGTSSLFSMTPQEPQVARTASEYARLMGDFPLADRLFGSFIVASGLGRDTRFNWDGSRYLANYYLDTARLGPGIETARRALSQLIEVQGPRQLTRSSQPAKFIALFSRFGDVAFLLNHVRDRKTDYPSSTLLVLLEREASEALGQWQDTFEITARLNATERPPMPDIALAAVKGRAGAIDEAIGLYERAIAADPNVPEYVRPALLELYARDSRWQAAEKLIVGPAGAHSGAWLSLGSFYERYGQNDFAARAFGRLDDLSIEIGPREFAGIVRFFSMRDPAKAASMLARRLSAETSFDSRYEYLSECMPQEARQCPFYLTVGAGLRNGPLAADRRLLGLFYRLLSIRAARIRDYETALSAARSACEEDPNDIRNMQQLLDLSLDLDPGRAEGIARSVAAALPLPASFLKLASAEFALKRDPSAATHFADALSIPLSPSDAHRITCLLLGRGLSPGLAARAATSISSAWSWVLVARLADAALSSADRKTAADLASSVASSGSYAGRSLWLADFHARAGAPTDALAAMALGLAQNANHPASTVAEVDFARASGSTTTASEALARAAGRNPRPQFAALFRMERARIAAHSRRGGDK